MKTEMERLQKMLAEGKLSPKEFGDEVLKLAAAQNKATDEATSARKRVRIRGTKTGGLSVGPGNWASTSYPCWAYVGQWVRLLERVPLIIEGLWDRENGPLEGDDRALQVLEQDGETRNIRPGDLPNKTEFIEKLISQLTAMLPAKEIKEDPVITQEETMEPEKETTEEPETSEEPTEGRRNRNRRAA